MKKIKSEFELLKEMCFMHAPSGNEVGMKMFLLNYIKENSKNWKHKPWTLEAHTPAVFAIGR